MSNLINRALTILALAFIVTVMVSTGHNASAQTFAEVFTKATSPHSELTVRGNFNRPIVGPLDFNAFFLTSSGWAEAYAGPSLTLSLHGSKVDLGLSAGGEQDGADGFKPRYAASLYAEHGHLSLLGIFEANNGVFRGNDAGLWYEITGKAKVLPWLYAGFKDKRPSGMGPYVQVKLPQKVAIWATWHLLGSEDLHWQPSKVSLGVRVGF